MLAPLIWNASATSLYVASRNMAWALGTTIIVWSLLRSMWPQVQLGQGYHTPALIVHRTITAVVISAGALGVVRGLLQINDALVKALIPPSAITWIPLTGASLVLSPVIALVVSLVLLALILYLGIFYVLRTIEIFVLTALIPWLALWWIHSTDDGLLRNVGRELMVAIFIQSVHAGTFWLFIHLVVHGPSTAMLPLEEIGVLWYMAKLPDQLRRLVGSPAKGGMWSWR